MTETDQERFDRRAAFTLIGVMCIFSVTAAANDDYYLSAATGIVHYSKDNNGQYYQDGHRNTKNYTGRMVSAALGRSYGKVSIEVNGQLLRGGQICAEYEHDNTYQFLVENADHSVTGVGNSEWSYRAVGLEGGYAIVPALRLRAGVSYWRGEWNMYHVETDRPGELQTFNVQGHGLSPTVGVDLHLNKQWLLNVTRYLDLYMQDGGVSAATRLTVGVKF